MLLPGPVIHCRKGHKGNSQRGFIVEYNNVLWIMPILVFSALVLGVPTKAGSDESYMIMAWTPGDGSLCGLLKISKQLQDTSQRALSAWTANVITSFIAQYF